MLSELGKYLGQSASYNIFETIIVLLGILYWVWIVKLALEE